ncbi:MAG: hypothetical protein M3Z95_05070, partial [Actinomycetota bacterium]|nr:hypothetical protein [Actinomycetota bacterium]
GTPARAPARTSSPARAHGAGLPAAIRAVCRHIRAHSGALHVASRRKVLRILATGDSMIYPIDQELAIERPAGMRVVRERHDGSGLTTAMIDWARLSVRQAARVRPDVTVISLGGRDAGIPLRDARHRLVACCAAAWLGLYAGLVRPLVSAYLRGGRARVYWLLLPAPREALRAPLFEAVNDAVRLLAPQFGTALRLIATDAAISPGGYQQVVTYDGLKIRPRAPDGIHLNHEGACVERGLVTEALRADGLLH